MDNRMCGGRIQLGTMGVRVADDIAGKFHDGKLHAKTQAKERNLMLTGIFDGLNLAFNTAGAKAARYQNAADITEKFTDILGSYSLGVDPFVLTLARFATPPCFKDSTTEM